MFKDNFIFNKPEVLQFNKDQLLDKYKLKTVNSKHKLLHWELNSKPTKDNFLYSKTKTVNWLTKTANYNLQFLNYKVPLNKPQTSKLKDKDYKEKLLT